MPCGREIRLRRVKSLRRWGIYFISLDAKRQISQFAEQIISPWAKRTISLFVKIKRFEYWARSVSRLGAPHCLRQMKRCYEQEETTSIAKRSTVLGCSISFVSAFGENSFITHLVLSPKGKPFRNPRIVRLCFWPKGSLTWVQRGDGSYRQPRYTKAVGFLSWFYGFNRNLVKMILMSLEKCNQYLNTIDTLPIVWYIRIIKYYWFELRKL